jgi:hypothetical protein
MDLRAVSGEGELPMSVVLGVSGLPEVNDRVGWDRRRVVQVCVPGHSPPGGQQEVGERWKPPHAPVIRQHREGGDHHGWCAERPEKRLQSRRAGGEVDPSPPQLLSRGRTQSASWSKTLLPMTRQT